jgi:hypothetical protein
MQPHTSALIGIASVAAVNCRYSSKVPKHYSHIQQQCSNLRQHRR